MSLISFARDILPLFRPVDIAHMKARGVNLDDYGYMSDSSNSHQNVERVQQTVSPQGGAPPEMPPGGPYWTPEQLALFGQWRIDGYQP
jgi:hypothetical protein